MFTTIVAIAILFPPSLACAPKPRTPVYPEAITRGNCITCHPKQPREMLQSKHIHKGIGCITCHGSSEAHTKSPEKRPKPDRVFPRAAVDEWCNTCHEAYCPLAQRQLRSRKPPEKTCAECHGAHTARVPPKGADTKPKPAPKKSKK